MKRIDEATLVARISFGAMDDSTVNEDQRPGIALLHFPLIGISWTIPPPRLAVNLILRNHRFKCGRPVFAHEPLGDGPIELVRSRKKRQATIALSTVL